MEHRLIRTFDVGAWLQRTHKSRHLIGRDVGRECRMAIEQHLATSAAGSVTTLDCHGIEHLDFTAADECFARLILRLQSLEYGDVFMVLAGMTPTHEENLVVALERFALAALVQRKDGPDILGDLDEYLREAFTLLRAHKVATARDVADVMGVEISLASTKFLGLHKTRLVQRVSQRMPEGGRQFVYRLVEGSLVG